MNNSDKMKQAKTWGEFLEALDGLLEEIERVDREELKCNEYKTLKMMVTDERRFPNRGYNNIEELV